VIFVAYYSYKQVARSKCSLFTNFVEDEFSEVRHPLATPKQPHKSLIWVMYRLAMLATIVATASVAGDREHRPWGFGGEENA
jgi:hypothetical protein